MTISKSGLIATQPGKIRVAVSGTIPSPSILAELKLQTSSQHGTLEKGSDIWGCLSSRPRYEKLVCTFYGIYLPLETRLASIEGLKGVLPDLPHRWKLNALTNDLDALQLPVDACPVCDDLPSIKTLPSALGCLYVLEGSTLGGQVIARRVHDQLGLTGETGGNFFLSYGPRTGEMWERFKEALELFCTNNESSRGEIIDAAVNTFECFSRWLVRKSIPHSLVS